MYNNDDISDDFLNIFNNKIGKKKITLSEKQYFVMTVGQPMLEVILFQR